MSPSNRNSASNGLTPNYSRPLSSRASTERRLSSASEILRHHEIPRPVVPALLNHIQSPLQPRASQIPRTYNHHILHQVQTGRYRQDIQPTERISEALMRPPFRHSCPEPQIRSTTAHPHNHDVPVYSKAVPIESQSLKLLVCAGVAARNRRARGRSIRPRLVDIV